MEKSTRIGHETKLKSCFICQVYTQVGLELARVTVTDCNNELVYDTFVRPDTKVIDFNTRYTFI